LGSAPFDGRIAIGEGERDEAPMLYIGEELGKGVGIAGSILVDIAVDPLECTTNCAKNLPNALAVLAAAPRGALLHAPDTYMDKIAGTPDLKGVVSLDASIEENILAVASTKGVQVSGVRVVMLDRPRHQDQIHQLRELGVSLTLMSDGDISAAIWAARPDGPFDLLLGVGAAPEGVIAATAIRGLGGVFEGRLSFRDQVDRMRAEKMLPGVDLDRVFSAEDLCTSTDAIFVATGVNSGYLEGVVETTNGMQTTTEVIDVQSRTVRLISELKEQ